MRLPSSVVFCLALAVTACGESESHITPRASQASQCRDNCPMSANQDCTTYFLNSGSVESAPGICLLGYDRNPATPGPTPAMICNCVPICPDDCDACTGPIVVDCPNGPCACRFEATPTPPPSVPEVRFQIGPARGSTAAPVSFAVQSLFAGSVFHSFPEGMQFTTGGVFSFYLEGATEPYGGTFVRAMHSTDIAVQEALFTVPGTPQIIATSDTTGKDPPVATVIIPTTATPPVTPVTVSPEVRFDVCAPTAGQSSCFTPGASGASGVAFVATIGDAFVTYLLDRSGSYATPSMIFLESARDRVNGVFQNPAGQLLLVQLFVDGQLRQSKLGTFQVVLSLEL